MDLYKQGLSVQELINQQALQKQQQQQNAQILQQQQIATQQAQQGQKDTEKFNKSFQDANGDWDQTIKNATKNGASGQFITQRQIARADQVTKLATADKDTLANAQTREDAIAKDAYALLQIKDPQERSTTQQQLINKHLMGGGGFKSTDFPDHTLSDDELNTTIVHNTAAQALYKEALALQEQKAKLPGEQAEATAKGYSTAAQTMGGANEQMGWTARRNLAVKNNADMAALIPEQYSPQAAEQVRQLGVAPKDLATMAPDKLEFQDFLKHPAKGYPGTPVGFMQFKADQSANAQVRAVQMLTGGGGANGGSAQPTPSGGAASSGAAPAPANTPG